MKKELTAALLSNRSPREAVWFFGSSVVLTIALLATSAQAIVGPANGWIAPSLLALIAAITASVADRTLRCQMVRLLTHQ